MATLDHVALAVSDPARSLAFYRDVVGVEAVVHEKTYGYVLATPTGVAFTLFAGTPPLSVGEMHVGVNLHDAGAVHEARARFAAAGVREVEWSDEPGYVSVKVADPDGYVVEMAWDLDHPRQGAPATGS